MNTTVVWHVLPDLGDERGSSFSLPPTWLCRVDGAVDVHISSLRPDQTRGDHYHLLKRELLIVSHRDRWTLHWDSGDGTPAQSRDFDGSGAVLIEVPIGVSHAVHNSGSVELSIIGLCDKEHDLLAPDAHSRKVS